MLEFAIEIHLFVRVQGEVVIEQGQAQDRIVVVREGTTSRHHRDSQTGRMHLIEC